MHTWGGVVVVCALLASSFGCRSARAAADLSEPKAPPALIEQQPSSDQPESQLSGDLREQVVQAMLKAATYFHDTVATHGGYVYYYSLDLTQRWGEGVAGPEEIWVQPPGTPAVGMAYLKAYEATGDSFYLDAATDAARALVYGQLSTGGWRNRINFAFPRADMRLYYKELGEHGNNVSSLDDDQTQAAIRLLVQVDKALNFQDREINQSARFALDSLLAAQASNGAFPQGWEVPTPPQPVVKAKYPTYDWRTENKENVYWKSYTLNDNVGRFVARTLKEAYDVYGEERYMEALRRLGDFFILAQMPDPQPGWAQQYDFEMRPIWARRFEPAAITGGESQGVMDTLLDIYSYTRDEKYLNPIPRALEYYKSSLLPDGRLARYYELQTNTPLYMTRDEEGVYSLTYDDTNLPRHYGYKVRSRLDRIEQRYNELKQGAPAEVESGSPEDQEELVREIIEAMDSQGRWIGRSIGTREQDAQQGGPQAGQQGGPRGFQRGGRRGIRIGLTGQPRFPSPDFQYLASGMFNRCIETLSDYLIATQPEAAPTAVAGSAESTPETQAPQPVVQ
jgi:hypothetical protein